MLYRLITIHSSDAHGGQLAAVAVDAQGQPITHQLRRGAAAADRAWGSFAAREKRFDRTRHATVVDAHTAGLGGTFSAESWTLHDAPPMSYDEAMRKVHEAAQEVR